MFNKLRKIFSVTNFIYDNTYVSFNFYQLNQLNLISCQLYNIITPRNQFQGSFYISYSHKTTKFIMDSTQIIKRRLAQLKKMSIQLKESTQNTNEVDFNVVYGIIQATKSSASKMTQRNSSQKNSNRNDSPLAKLLAMNKSPAQPYKSLFPQTRNSQRQRKGTSASSNSYIRNSAQQNGFNQNAYSQQYYISPDQQLQEQADQFIGELGLQNRQINGNQYYNNNQSQHYYNNPLQSQQQIVSLRQQNNQLQRNILNLRHELHQLRQKLQTINQQQQWKAGLPFFKLNQKIQAFYTRLKINQNDYSKIDYVSYDAELTLDKLVVKKSSGMGTVKELDLTELRDVYYVDSIIILLHFGVVNQQKNLRSSGRDRDETNKSNKSDKYSNQDFMQNFFIKFKNQQQLHRWDLALFINFKIIQSLKKDKLFTMSMTRSRSKSRKRSSQSKYLNDSHKKSKRSSDHIYEDDQDLMKKLVQRRDLYLETKKMVSQRMIQKVNEKKNNIFSDHNKKNTQNNYQDDEQYSQTHPFQIQEQSLKTTSKLGFGKNSSDLQGTYNQKNQRSNTSKFKDFMGENLNNVENVIVPSLNIGANNERGLSFNPGDYDLSISKKLQQERIKQQNEQKTISQTKRKRIKQIIRKMTTQGYELTKYSKDGFNPHQKRVFLSQDLSKFCWQQEGGKDRKQIEMKSIKQIQQQKIGEGIRKHIKKPKKEQHCIISYMKDNKLKVIQLGANSTVMEQFIEQLNAIRDYLKQNDSQR